ncbi:MAG: RluA family pseudouridine synthase [Muribaculaceae bacterium]|nr:RluA family pseudouridine synthase [Muribaculaceae bacterium]
MNKQNDKNSKYKQKPDSIATYSVTDNDPATLLEYVSHVLSDHTPTKVKSMLKHNQFAVNSMPTTQFNAPLHPGDNVSINFTKSFRVFSHPRISLVYEDNDILVINKGYGLLSMSTDRIKEGTAYSIMREYVKYSDPRTKVFIVHRLDRDTSGLMMLAKTPEAKETLQHNWNNMVLNRKYVCVVEGIVDCPNGVIKSYLAENSRYEVYSTEDSNLGQLAVTRYVTLRTGNGKSLLEVELDTGRKNQIRVHMKDIGHPIVGDRKYGAASSPINRLALHAQTLRFVHPITRREMCFETPIPARFLSLVSR